MIARSPKPTTPVSSSTSAEGPTQADGCRIGLEGFERSHAVLIGIDDYAEPVPKLTTPVRDVEEVDTVLRTHHGFSTKLLRNSEATASALANTLSGLAERVDTHDRVLIYFAGHGVVDPNAPGAGGPRGYLFPHGADRTDSSTLLAMDKFYELVLALKCRHMLVVLDCCFSGAFRWAGMRSFVPTPAKLDTQRLEWFVRYPAWQVLASSAHDQTAADLAAGRTFGNRDDGGEHSPFAAAFISGLKGDADAGTADAGPDGIITATELFLHTERSLFASVGARQRPQLWHLEKQKYGEFIFRTPKRDLNVPPPPDLNADTNPWRGFKSYEPEDRDIFFGRGGVSEQLLEKCLAEPVTIVSGASGSGKSSLVRAGLVWRAQALGLSCTIMRPGSDPYSGLAAALASFTAGGAAAPDAATLARDRDSLKNWLHRRSGPPLLLVIDQAEELVTQWMPRSNTIDRQNAIADFVSLLAGALDARSTERGALTFDNAERAGDAIKARGWIPLETPVKNDETIWSARAQRNDQVETIDLLAPVYKLHVVATVREEFASSLNGFAIAQWRPSLFAVPRLEQDDLRRIILGPAAAKAMRFESEQLVDDLVNDVVGMPGSPPLMHGSLPVTAAAAWSPDGSKIATSSVGFKTENKKIDALVRVWNAESSAVLDHQSYDADVYDVSWSPRDQQLAIAEGDARIMLWKDGKWLDHPGSRMLDDRYPDAIEFVGNGSVIAARLHDGTLLMRDLDLGRDVYTIDPGAHPVKTFATSPDGTLLATGHGDGVVRLMSMPAMPELLANAKSVLPRGMCEEERRRHQTRPMGDTGSRLSTEWCEKPR